jgi:Myb-like DNA-binding domain
MTTLLTPPRASISTSHYSQYSPRYSSLDSSRLSYYPTTPTRGERRDREPYSQTHLASPGTPTTSAVRSPPASASARPVTPSSRPPTASFHILASSSVTPSQKPIKGPWTPSEDHRLLALVNELGAEKWVVIASRLGSRTGKQCRERWHNHVNPILNKSPFTLEEEEAIERLYAELGPKWAEIAKKLPGRSMFFVCTPANYR